MKGFFVCFYKKNPSKYDFEGFCGGPTCPTNIHISKFKILKIN